MRIAACPRSKGWQSEPRDASVVGLATGLPRTKTLVGTVSKRRLIPLLLALGILALGVYLLQLSFASPVDSGWKPDTDPVGNAGAAKAAGEVQAATEEAPPDKRVAVPTEAAGSSASEVGTLVLRVLWPDGGPAADVAVDLTGSEPFWRRFSDTLGWQLTDVKGEVRYENIPAGEYWYASSRRGMDWDRVNVVAGTVTEAVIKLDGFDVHGRVVDGSGAGVANAGIWMTTGYTGWLGGRVVTHSDGNGDFRIRSAGQGQSLGALFRGFAPSELVDLEDVDTSKAPVAVRLVLSKPGGTVTGTVTSPTGKVVPGADVCVGKKPRHFDFRRSGHGARETWTPLTACTDATGRFKLPWVAPGKHPVAVRSRGLPIWKDEVVVKAGETSHLDVKLLAGVVVHGVVKDMAGKPVVNAVVRAYDTALDERYIQAGQFDYDGIFGFAHTAADAQGRYRLGGIAPGSIHLYATRVRTTGQTTLVRAKTVLKGDAGEELEWNPVLDPGHTIEGLVTFRDGVPMQHVFVTAWHEKTNEYQALTTNREGRFRFTNLTLAHYRLTVQYPFRGVPKDAPPLVKTKVWPDTGEVYLAAVFDSPTKEAPGSVRGRVHDAAERHTRQGTLGVRLISGRGWRTEKVKKDGTFAFEKIAPGRCRVMVTSGEKVIHAGEEFDLAPAQRFDVGTLVTEPGGSVRLRFVREKGTEKIEPRVWLRHLKDKHSVEIRPKRATEHLEENLCVGSYDARVFARGIVDTRVPFDVRAGEESVVELRFRPAAHCPLVFVLPERLPEKLEYVITDAKGGVAAQRSMTLSPRYPNPLQSMVQLPVGRYTMTVSTSEGFSTKQEFEVKDLTAEVPAIRIEISSR